MLDREAMFAQEVELLLEVAERPKGRIEGSVDLRRREREPSDRTAGPMRARGRALA